MVFGLGRSAKANIYPEHLEMNQDRSIVDVVYLFLLGNLVVEDLLIGSKLDTCIQKNQKFT
tara:strand:- start:328 stop:510 length:183 start_codon:yes stop_codon:yes gene_type:complete